MDGYEENTESAPAPLSPCPLKAPLSHTVGGRVHLFPSHSLCLSTACNPSLCKAKGRGLQPKGLRVKETADFQVFTKGAGTGELKVSIKGPNSRILVT
ncbi:hypothetical protein CesoFtcFv8_010813 [Champsocephalus esox]|uniref:Uncharacterized protein n=1 Tax=Champsocephalus esox TaxID=159716 RepID=A0AAN8C1C9_9TELE|nr:hypothetical protein CesoFtcFv8_010813 [Champsocephalus esox]